nr:reverse transcriptase domain-containing protein [Tanacetum cinerariifolium]
MSSSNNPFIVASDSDIEDAFSSTNSLDYTLALPDYFPASPGNTSPDSSNDLTKDLLASLAFSPFHDDPYMKVIMPPKRTSTSATPAMTQAAIRKLVADSVVASLETQTATMANTKNTNRNTRPRETPIARKGNYKEFKAVNLSTLMVRKEQLDLFVSLNVLNRLTLKGNDLKTYVRRFQKLAVLCPSMVPNTKKLMEVFIGGLPLIIEGTITALKPQTLEEATNIAQRLMDQIIKHGSMQGTNDHKQRFDDRRNTTNNSNYPNNRINNYQNNCNNNSNRNNDYRQQ